MALDEQLALDFAVLDRESVERVYPCHQEPSSGGQVRDQQCFYCSGRVRTTGVGDHFPLPKRHGGTLTVPCCESCHDMKDRFPLDRWPLEWIGIVIEQWPVLRRETRIFLAKSIALYSDARAIRRYTEAHAEKRGRAKKSQGAQEGESCQVTSDRTS